MRVDNTLTLDWTDTAKCLLNNLFPYDNENNDTAEQKIDRLNQNITPDGITPNFTFRELSDALAKMKHRKAPGPDSFDLAIVTAAMPTISMYLLDIYNSCLKFGVFPNEWKVGQVVTIRKKSDNVPTDPASYRPICLLPILGKLLESIILKKLNKLIDHKLSNSQYGFRVGKSTEDAIVKFRKIIKDSNSKYFLAVFFDIKGAFDNV